MIQNTLDKAAEDIGWVHGRLITMTVMRKMSPTVIGWIIVRLKDTITELEKL